LKPHDILTVNNALVNCGCTCSGQTPFAVC